MRFFQTQVRIGRTNLFSLLILSLICLSLSGCLLLAVGGGAAAGGYILAQKSNDKPREFGDHTSDAPSTMSSDQK